MHLNRNISKNVRFEYENVGLEVHTAVDEGATDFCLLQNFQTGCEAHPASYSNGYGVLSLRQSGWGVKLTTHLCLGQRLRMSGAVPFSPSCLYGVDREHITYTAVNDNL
jgi:hypothetical protein